MHRFDANLPEQNLLNYAHRRDGNMPWQTLWYGWNVHFASSEDLEGGVASVHEKWWRPFVHPNEDGGRMGTWGLERKVEMEVCFNERDVRMGHS
jgi:hypothetical protein